MYIRKKHFKS